MPTPYPGFSQDCGCQAPSQPEQISGPLVSNVDANGFEVNNLGGLSVGYMDTKEIWIAHRTGGKLGSGSKIDPFDGSTAEKFDQIVSSQPENAIINLYDEEFETNGIELGGCVMKKGQKIIGHGAKVTLINTGVQGVGVWGNTAMGHPYNVDGSNSLVEGIFFDLNKDYLETLHSGQPSRSQAVVLRGNNCRINNVEVINAHSNLAAGLETFVLIIGDYFNGTIYPDYYGAVIEQCYLHDCQGVDYGSACNIFGSGSTANAPNPPARYFGVIRNCIVKDWIGYTGAYAAPLVEHNTAIDCHRFMYWEPRDERWRPVIARNNHAIVGQGFAPSVGSGGFILINSGYADSFTDGFVITDNIVQMYPDDATVGGTSFVYYNGPTDDVDNVVIKGNVVSTDPRAEANGSLDYVAIRGFPAGHIFENNVFLGDFFYTTTVNDTNAAPKYSTNESHLDDTDAIGALRVTGEATNPQPGFSWRLPFSYTVADGDRLEYEVMVADSSTSFNPMVLLDGAMFAASVNTSQDQNGLLPYTELKSWARGRWYKRVFDLSEYAGTTSTGLLVGISGQLPDGQSTPAGLKTFYVKNAKIVGSSGLPKQLIYTDESRVAYNSIVAGAVLYATGTSISYDWNPKVNSRFSAHASGTQVITTGTDTKILFQTEESDTTSSFASSRFTARRPGWHTFTVNVMLNTANGNHTRLMLFKNGAVEVYALDSAAVHESGENIGGTYQMLLATGDYVEAWIHHNKGSDLTIDTATTGSFQGWEE